MILHGPPGVGKTTIARIVAEASAASFEELSAVSARIDDVRAVIARATDRLGGNGTRTLLFIDEIHRFDKRQQDSVLHAVEDGLVTLIGATTENPYFEVNQALLSRCTVVELEPLTLEDLDLVLARGARELGAELPRTSPRRSHGVQGATPAPRSRRSSSPGRRRRPPASRSLAATSRTPRGSDPSGTTVPATVTTTLRRRSSSRCAEAIPTPPFTTWRRCSRAAKIRGSSRDAS